MEDMRAQLRRLQRAETSAGESQHQLRHCHAVELVLAVGLSRQPPTVQITKLTC